MANKIIQFGGEWPGLDLKHDPRVTKGAQVSLNTRRDRGCLEAGVGYGSPSTITGAGDCRGLFAHRGVTGTITKLYADATGLYADGTLMKLHGGTDCTLAGSDAVVFAQDGERTYFVDGSSALRCFDPAATSPNKVFELTSLSGPSDLALSGALANVTTIDSLEAGTWDSTVWDGSAHPDVANEWAGNHPTESGNRFAVQEFLDSENASTTGLVGGYGMAISIGAGNTTGDFIATILRDGSNVKQAQDWSSYNEIVFEVMALVPCTMNFVFGEDDSGTGIPNPVQHQIPFTITSSKIWQTIRLDLSGILEADRNAVTAWGFELISAISGATYLRDIFVRDVRVGEGLRGTYKYLVTPVKDSTSGAVTIAVEGTESNELEVVVEGSLSTVNLGWTAVTGADHYKVYRLEEGVTANFHYVGTTDTNSYSDSARDVSANPTMTRYRAAIPSGASHVMANRGRIILEKGGDWWISRKIDPTTWFDVTPAELDDYDLIAADGMKLPAVGPIKASMPLGTWNGVEYSGELFVCIAGECILFRGDSPETFDVGFRIPGGGLGPYAITRDSDGNVYWIDQSGDIRKVNRQVQAVKLSEPIEEYLRTLPVAGRSDWVLGFDPQVGVLYLQVVTAV